MAKIILNVNDQRHVLNVDASTPLIYVLRNDLGLKGVKLGCGLEQCGACKVIVDGEAVFSCSSPVGIFEGKSITTIEGLGSADKPHRVQQAFIDEGAAQCGYCIPGIVVATKALLDVNPNPDTDEILATLSDHLCRCGTHNRILRAIKRAAREAG
jgi:nicotinate dehydrogenase subunit A